jgi:hypothetical protein
MASQILGLTGYARHGKDTAAAVLVNEYGFTRVSFADGVRSMALAIDPFITAGIRLSSIVRVGGWEQAKAVPEVRRLLQKIGTEGVRDHIGYDSWVKAGKVKINAIDGPVVITDVRFLNEAQAVLDWGGYMIRLVRVNEDGSEFDNGVSKDHPSEASIRDLPVHRTACASSVSSLENQARGWVSVQDGIPSWAWAI